MLIVFQLKFNEIILWSLLPTFLLYEHKRVAITRINTEVHVGAMVASEVYVGPVEVKHKCKSVIASLVVCVGSVGSGGEYRPCMLVQ